MKNSSIPLLNKHFLFWCLLVSTFLFFYGCNNRPSPPKGLRPSKPDKVPYSQPVNHPQDKIDLNVYLENSGSMDGYVYGTTDFESSVYSYLSELEDLDFINKKQLNYINSEVLPQPDNLRSFIENLEPSTFKEKGGNRGSTDIQNILSEIIGRSSDNAIDVFISDCVFSPGKQYVSNNEADNYLMQQQIAVSSIISEHLKKHPGFTIVIYRLTSGFNGIYYNRLDEGVSINDSRPFYIWLMGSENELRRIISSVNTDEIKGSGVLNSFTVANTSHTINYAITMKSKIGSWTPDPENPGKSIIKAKVDKRSGFSLTIGVDFSDLVFDDHYVMDPNNYVISNKSYKITIEKSSDDNYTHYIKLTLLSKIISKGPIYIRLKSAYPAWSEVFSDVTGLKISNKKAMGQTYGLKNLIGGICDAYNVSENKENNQDYASLEINIQ
jgi:hypothetical protein